MTTPTVKHDVLGLSRAQWQSLLTELGEKPFRTTQIMKWLHHRSVDDFESMTDISKNLRAYLAEHAEIAEPPVKSEKISKDGPIKWLLEARGTLIVRQLCELLEPRQVFVTLAAALQHEEDLDFASQMVQTLNLILITSGEAWELRRTGPPRRSCRAAARCSRCGR